MRKNLTVNYEINPKPYATELFTAEAVRTIKDHDQNQPLFLLGEFFIDKKIIAHFATLAIISQPFGTTCWKYCS